MAHMSMTNTIVDVEVGTKENRMAIEEALDSLHQEIDELGLAPTQYGVYDDEDMIIFAINYLARNLNGNEIFEPKEERE